MSQFPNLSDGQPFRQTTKRTNSLSTTVMRFLDMSEQRWVNRTPVQRFEGSYEDINFADYSGAGTSHSLQDFADSMQGRFGQFDVTFPAGGTLYSNVYFDGADRLNFQEKSVNLYATMVKLKQFPAGGFPTITVVNPNLPTLGASGNSGPLNQYPNQLFHTWSNSVVDLDDAQRYVYARISSPIAGGVLQLAAITDAELANFEAFFLQVAGRYGIFTINGYNGVNYTHARFDTDSFIVDYSLGPGINSVVLPWVTVPV